MKYINIKYGLATGISIAIDENLSEDKIHQLLWKNYLFQLKNDKRGEINELI
jgi:hypothetical protein